MKKVFIYSFIFLTLSVFGNQDNKTSDFNSIFNEGVDNYKNAQYFEAIENFQKILSNNVENFEIYYNLGNSYFKTNNIPNAIYYYEKALQLKPHDEDVLHNLNYANALLKTDIEAIPEAFHIKFLDWAMKLLSPNNWAIISIIFCFLTFIAISLFLFQNKLFVKTILFYISLVFLLLTLSSIGLGLRAKSSIKYPNHAIVMSASIGVKSSPSQSSADIYVAQAGLKVKILSKLGDWYEIRVPDGNKGWVHIETLKEI